MQAIARQILFAGAAGVALLSSGCAHVAVEGGEKPIHIVMDVNLKVDHELDQFFAFEQHAATQPTSAPSTSAVGVAQ